MTNERNPHLGSTLDKLLEEDGALADTHAIAIRRVLAWQVGQTMSSIGFSRHTLFPSYTP